MDRLQLSKMIDANNVKDCTDDIREKKHSDKIREDVQRLVALKAKYSRLVQTNPEQFDMLCVSQCNFLFNNYTDIFNKVKKDEISLDILGQLLIVLKKIETGVLDQHAGAYEVGMLMKTIYIDSALMKAEKFDKVTGKSKKVKVKAPKKLSWKDFKQQQQPSQREMEVIVEEDADADADAEGAHAHAAEGAHAHAAEGAHTP